MKLQAPAQTTSCVASPIIAKRITSPMSVSPILRASPGTYVSHTTTQPVFCLFGSPPTPPPPAATTFTVPFTLTSASAGLGPPPLVPSFGSGLLIVGGRYWPLLPIGLPTGAPMRLVWLSCGLKVLPRWAASRPCCCCCPPDAPKPDPLALTPGPGLPATAANVIGVGPGFLPLASPILLLSVGATCCPLRFTGLDFV